MDPVFLYLLLKPRNLGVSILLSYILGRRMFKKSRDIEACLLLQKLQVSRLQIARKGDYCSEKVGYLVT
jgi:hypothetical protein